MTELSADSSQSPATACGVIELSADFSPSPADHKVLFRLLDQQLAAQGFHHDPTIFLEKDARPASAKIADGVEFLVDTTCTGGDISEKLRTQPDEIARAARALSDYLIGAQDICPELPTGVAWVSQGDYGKVRARCGRHKSWTLNLSSSLFEEIDQVIRKLMETRVAYAAQADIVLVPDRSLMAKVHYQPKTGRFAAQVEAINFTANVGTFLQKTAARDEAMRLVQYILARSHDVILGPKYMYFLRDRFNDARERWSREAGGATFLETAAKAEVELEVGSQTSSEEETAPAQMQIQWRSPRGRGKDLCQAGRSTQVQSSMGRSRKVRRGGQGAARGKSGGVRLQVRSD